MHLRSLAPALVGCLLAACGGKSGSGPSPTVSSVVISPGPDVLKIKGTETFTANATMSNGSTTAVSATWRSSNPAVATIDGGGRATGVGSGIAAITAEYQGMASAPRSLRVVPDYQGTWRGRIDVRACTETGDWLASGFCRMLGTGDVDYMEVKMTQQNAAIASATVDVGGFAGGVTGSIADNGALTLNGGYSVTMDDIPFRLTVSDWQSTSTDNERMTGRFVFVVAAPPINGDARMDIALLNVSKTSTTALTTSGTGGPGALWRSLKSMRRPR